MRRRRFERGPEVRAVVGSSDVVDEEEVDEALERGGDRDICRCRCVGGTAEICAPGKGWNARPDG